MVMPFEISMELALKIGEMEQRPIHHESSGDEE